MLYNYFLVKFLCNNWNAIKKTYSMRNSYINNKTTKYTKESYIYKHFLFIYKHIYWICSALSFLALQWLSIIPNFLYC